MRFVFLNQYYPPDAAPTGVMLKSVVERLAAAGHEVTVICGSGGYADAPPEAGELQGSPPPPGPGVRILRIGATRFGRGSFVGKLLDYLSYYLGVAWRLLVMHPGPDRIVALTTPPYLSILARAVSKIRGADHGHWVMDLYPDVMAAHGMLRETGVLYRFLTALARWGFGGKRCAAVLVLGPDMVERVRRMSGGKGRPPEWVALWASTDDAGEATAPLVATESIALRQARGWPDDAMVVMYSGNMGLGHRFGEILAAAEKCPATRFVFFGRGKRRLEIERSIAAKPAAPVELHGYAPAAILAAHLLSADVHLVSLDESWTGTMVPSKLQGIFSIGRPVIFIGGRESSIGRWVHDSGGGWRVGAGDHAGLLHALTEAADPAERARRGALARRFAEDHFNRETNVARVADVFAGPTAPRRG